MLGKILKGFTRIFHSIMIAKASVKVRISVYTKRGICYTTQGNNLDFKTGKYLKLVIKKAIFQTIPHLEY